MKKVKAIIKKELRLYYTTPVGYVFTAVMLCVAAILFTVFNLMDSNSSVSVIFSFLPWLFVIMIPLLTMRLLSEEKSNKTDQLLYTAPISMTSVILGKLFAALAVFCVTILIMLIFPIILEIYSDVEWGVVITNYIGFFLLGSTFISIGLFISSLTENQFVSGIITIAVILVMFVAASLAGGISNKAVNLLISVFAVPSRFDNFFIGIINITDVVYYISVTAIFALITIYKTEKVRFSK